MVTMTRLAFAAACACASMNNNDSGSMHAMIVDRACVCPLASATDGLATIEEVKTTNALAAVVHFYGNTNDKDDVISLINKDERTARATAYLVRRGVPTFASLSEHSKASPRATLTIIRQHELDVGPIDLIKAYDRGALSPDTEPDAWTGPIGRP